MFSAYLLIIGGTLGVLFELVQGYLVVNRDVLPYLFSDDIPLWSFLFSAATLAFGIVCLRTQAAVYGYLGAACAVLSMAIFGVVSFHGWCAVAAMLKSHLEGEETRNDGIKLHPALWPDKALAASLFLFVGGSLAAGQGIAIAFDRFDPIILKQTPAAAATIDIVAGIAMMLVSREIFHLRRPRLGYIAAGLGVVTLGLYVIGPALGITAVLLLRLAKAEDEFNPDVQARAKAQAARRQRKRKTAA